MHFFGNSLKFYLAFIFVLFSGSIFYAVGQSIQYPLVKVGPQQGFYAKYVHAISENDKGHMLFGSYGPDVFVHDGVSFSSLDGINLGGSQSFEIFRNGKIQILSSGNELFGVRPNQNEVYSIFKSNQKIRVHPQIDNTSYVSIGSMLYSLDSNDSLNHLLELGDWKIKQAVRINGQNLLILSEKGEVYSYEDVPGFIPQKLPISNVKVLLKTGNEVYAINNHILQLYNGKNEVAIQKVSDNEFGEIGAWTTGNNAAWFYTDKKLFRVSGKYFEEVALMPSTDILDIATLYESSEGTLWIGTYGQGLYKLYDLKIKTLVYEGSTLGNVISLFPLGNSHGVFAGTSKGLYQIRGDQVKKIDIPEFTIFSAARFSNNEIILGGEGFLMHLNLITGNKTILRHEILANTEVFAILFNNCSLFVATSIGLFEFDDKFKFIGEITKEDGVSMTSISHLESVDDETVLALDFAKPYIIQNNIASELELDNEFKSVYSVHRGKGNSIYLGSFGGIASQIDIINNRIEQNVHSLRSRNLYSILTNDEGDLLFGTEKGIELYGNSGNLFFDDRITHLESNINTLIVDPLSDGYLFGTVEGLYKIDSDYQTKARNIPKLLELKVNGTPHPIASSKIQLAHDENDIIFIVGIHDFVNSPESQFRFRLKGYCEQWVEGDITKGVQFTNLPSGNFQIMVETLHFQGDRHVYLLPIHIEILKPYWKENWFYFLLFLISAASISSGYLWLQRHNISKNRKLSQIISERTHEIQKMNESLEKKVINRTLELHNKNKELVYSIRQKEKSESLIQLISSNSQDIFCLLDENKRIVLISESTTTTIGKSPEELIGKPITSLMDDTRFQHDLQNYLNILDLEKQLPLILSSDENGAAALTIEIKAKKLKNHGDQVGKGFVLNIRNVSDRELLRREIKSIYKNIHRDFHDEVGNKLARIIALISVLKLHSYKSNNEKGTVDKIENAAKGLYRDTRDFIWSLDQENNTLEELCLQLRDFGENLFDGSNINFRFTSKIQNNKKLPPNTVRDILLIFKEVMTNVIKHSRATDCHFKFFQHQNYLLFLVKDNGIGMDFDNPKGIGLKNIRFRSTRSGGQIFIKSNRGSIIGMRIKI